MSGAECEPQHLPQRHHVACPAPHSARDNGLQGPGAKKPSGWQSNDGSDMAAAHLVLLRHGESSANALGLFTGDLDVGLTALGRSQSTLAGRLLRSSGIDLHRVLCSPLTRARETAGIVMAELQRPTEVVLEWRLSERSYGALTGRSKVDVLEEFGAARFLSWRRSVDQAPPPLSDDALARLRSQSALKGFPADVVASTESLQDVIERVRPLLEGRIVAWLRQGETMLVVAHGNSLRAVVAVLDGLDARHLKDLNIPAGQPLLYRVNDDGTPIGGSGEYLDPVAAQDAAAVLRREGGT